MIRTYDIDGVLCMNGWLGMRPASEFDVSITGRSFEEEEETLAFLEFHGIKNRVYFNEIPYEEKTRVKSGHHKANVINKLLRSGHDIAVHYEDDPEQIGIIRELTLHVLPATYVAPGPLWARQRLGLAGTARLALCFDLPPGAGCRAPAEEHPVVGGRCVGSRCTPAGAAHAHRRRRRRRRPGAVWAAHRGCRRAPDPGQREAGPAAGLQPPRHVPAAGPIAAKLGV